MKTYRSILGTALVTVTMAFLTLSCSDVTFESKKAVSVAATYAWHTEPFGLCSVPCGGGIQTRNVTCRSGAVTVDSSNCDNAGPKPSASQTCNIQTCAGSYSWNVGAWSICSKSCGGGTQTRTVLCQDNATGQNMAEAYCNATTPKPAVQQTCNTQACSQYTYGWQLVPNQCSKSCGGGFEKYICKRNDGQTMTDESYCTDPKPQVICNTQTCPGTYTYKWYAGAWSVCSKSCGGGVRSRDVICQREQDLQAMADVYCSGQSQPASQEVCNTQTCPDTGRDVTTKMTLPKPAVDVIMIVDDSTSMAADNLKLASRMSGFLSDLDNAHLDYRVCITSTDVRPLKPAGAPSGPYGWHGMPLVWGHYSGSTWVSSGSALMTNSTPNKAKVFTDTIKFIGSGYSSDEQGIGALSLMLDYYPNSGCFRSKSTLAVILISDEDERSVGGIQARSTAQYEPLTSRNYPDNLIAKVASKYNASNYVKPFIWNSIIVRPDDPKDASGFTACEKAQDAQGTPSFQGTLYNELSNKTGGYVESICNSDYAQGLRYMKDRVVQSMPYVELECVPSTTPQITISPNVSTNISLDGRRVRFNPALPEGTTVTVKYRCPN